MTITENGQRDELAREVWVDEAALRARREALAEVQAHVRDELEQVQPGGRPPCGPERASAAAALAKMDGYLSNLLIGHAAADSMNLALHHIGS